MKLYLQACLSEKEYGIDGLITGIHYLLKIIVKILTRP
jgi:hypothetical protein